MKLLERKKNTECYVCQWPSILELEKRAAYHVNETSFANLGLAKNGDFE
jgi:hypothetical protein